MREEGTHEGLAPPKARGQRRGRPPAFTAEQVRTPTDLRRAPGPAVQPYLPVFGEYCGKPLPAVG